MEDVSLMHAIWLTLRSLKASRRSSGYAMNEQIHELYRLENHFRAGVSVATDSIDWRIAIADIFCDGSMPPIE